MTGAIDAVSREAGNGFAESAAGWLGLVAITLFFIAMIPAMHFVPPLSPQLTGEDLAQHYREHAVGMRLGAVLIMTGAALMFPLFASMSTAMLRMRGRPVTLAWTQMACAIVTFFPFFATAFFFAAAGFRPERGADDIQVLSDLGWFWLVMPTPASFLQMFAFGIAVVGDDVRRPVLPRWIGYFNFMAGVLFFSGLFIPLFKSGPFAWDGLLAFWVPLVEFGIWVSVMSVAFIAFGRRIARGEIA